MDSPNPRPKLGGIRMTLDASATNREPENIESRLHWEVMEILVVGLKKNVMRVSLLNPCTC